MAIQNTRTSVLGNTRRTGPQSEREVSEFDGGWLNIGVKATIDGEERFIRLPLGVAVADLAKRKRKIYQTTIDNNPSRAAEMQIENDMIDQICAGFLSLGEGEHLETEMLGVQLFRRNEEVDTDNMVADAPKFDLFAKSDA